MENYSEQRNRGGENGGEWENLGSAVKFRTEQIFLTEEDRERARAIENAKVENSLKGQLAAAKEREDWPTVFKIKETLKRRHMGNVIGTKPLPVDEDNLIDLEALPQPENVVEVDIPVYEELPNAKQIQEQKQWNESARETVEFGRELNQEPPKSQESQGYQEPRVINGGIEPQQALDSSMTVAQEALVPDGSIEQTGQNEMSREDKRAQVLRLFQEKGRGCWKKGREGVIKAVVVLAMTFAMAINFAGCGAIDEQEEKTVIADDEDYIMNERSMERIRENSDGETEKQEEDSIERFVIDGSKLEYAANGLGYNTDDYVDFDRKISHEAFGTSRTEFFKDKEGSIASILNDCAKMPNILASHLFKLPNILMAAGFEKTDAEEMTYDKLIDLLVNAPNGGELQKNLLNAYEKALKGESTKSTDFVFYYEYGKEDTSYLYIPTSTSTSTPASENGEELIEHVGVDSGTVLLDVDEGEVTEEPVTPEALQDPEKKEEDATVVEGAVDVNEKNGISVNSIKPGDLVRGVEERDRHGEQQLRITFTYGENGENIEELDLNHDCGWQDNGVAGQTVDINEKIPKPDIPTPKPDIPTPKPDTTTPEPETTTPISTPIPASKNGEELIEHAGVDSGTVPLEVDEGEVTEEPVTPEAPRGGVETSGDEGLVGDSGDNTQEPTISVGGGPVGSNTEQDSSGNTAAERTEEAEQQIDSKTGKPMGKIAY